MNSQNLINVSCETLMDLESYVEQLIHWNKTINLISQKSLAEIWHRHIYDSYQIFFYFPQKAKYLIDFGSGGGLPAIVCAICAKHTQRPLHFMLIESDKRKAVFLRRISHILDLQISVIDQRIEHVKPIKADIITARALAALPALFSYARPFLSDKTICLFPKGEHWLNEVKLARKYWYFDDILHPSKSESSAVILEIRNLKKLT